jgi:hypothetical protein
MFLRWVLMKNNLEVDTDTSQLLSLRWEHHLKKRYYKVVLSRDLLGDWVLTRVWGGIGQATGKITHIYCVTYEDGLRLADTITKTRIKKGYAMVKV